MNAPDLSFSFPLTAVLSNNSVVVKYNTSQIFPPGGNQAKNLRATHLVISPESTRCCKVSGSFRIAV